tara:strand:+ start:434 stop:1093 length:660 start_codon:yes stop_codon:yes gene_type:complete
MLLNSGTPSATTLQKDVQEDTQKKKKKKNSIVSLRFTKLQPTVFQPSLGLQPVVFFRARNNGEVKEKLEVIKAVTACYGMLFDSTEGSGGTPSSFFIFRKKKIGSLSPYPVGTVTSSLSDDGADQSTARLRIELNKRQRLAPGKGRKYVILVSKTSNDSAGDSDDDGFSILLRYLRTDKGYITLQSRRGNTRPIVRAQIRRGWKGRLNMETASMFNTDT